MFSDAPPGWIVPANAAPGSGRLTLKIDRQQLPGDLVATVLLDEKENSDIAIQLFDHENRVVALDLFGNLVSVGKDFSTDTFVIPLRKYPSAEKIVVRQINGAVSLRGMVLYPVVTEGEPVPEALRKLAAVLRDPLSDENPLAKSLQQIAVKTKSQIDPILQSGAATETKASGPKYYDAATIIPAVVAQPVPEAGLAAHWSFDGAILTDSGPLKLPAHGRYGFSDGVRGGALRLDGAVRQSVTIEHSPALDLKDSLTVSAWIKYSSIAPNWGSEIAWYGDRQLGRDPWQLHLLPGGYLEFRSDRSVTGTPVFTVFDNEIQLSKTGAPQQNQHVGVIAPNLLSPNVWYFVAGSIEKSGQHSSIFRLYVNGQQVSQVRTDEVVDYDTNTMWMQIGSVDKGEWQNYSGLIDELRVYNRALSKDEITALYSEVR